MWSVGVIIFILLAGYAPFDDDSDAVLYQKIRKGEHDMGDPIWLTISPDARDLVVRASPDAVLKMHQQTQHSDSIRWPADFSTVDDSLWHDD